MADGVSGLATVIARLGDDQYAFHRGEQLLAMADPARSQRGIGGGGYRGPGDTVAPMQQQEYLKNVIDFNEQQMLDRGTRYKDNVVRERKGVQVRQVK